MTNKGGRPIGKLHQEDVRRKIQVSQLLNVLNAQALGTAENELTPVRLKAIEILLRKSLPDLSSIQLEDGKGNGPSIAEIVRAYSKQEQELEGERRDSDPAIP